MLEVLCRDLTKPVSDRIGIFVFPQLPTLPNPTAIRLEVSETEHLQVWGSRSQGPEFLADPTHPHFIGCLIWGSSGPSKTQFPHLCSGRAVLRRSRVTSAWALGSFSCPCPTPPSLPPGLHTPGLEGRRARAAAPTAKPSPAASRDLDATGNPRTGPLI